MFRENVALINDTDAREAVCVMTADTNMWWGHTTHCMMYLYKCWSWWMLHPNARRTLYDEAGVTSTWLGNYTGEFLKMLRRQGVEIFVKGQLSEFQKRGAATPLEHWGFDAEDHWFAAPGHAAALAAAAVPRGLMRGCPPLVPRVRLVNRAQSRRILNSALLLELLKPHASAVEEIVFDGASFMDQVLFMHRTDILISAHGNTLVSLPFMSRCGAVLEVFPRGFFIPGSMGNLAYDIGLYSMWFYHSDGNRLRETGRSFAKSSTRHWARNVMLCPRPGTILEAVRELGTRRGPCVTTCRFDLNL